MIQKAAVFLFEIVDNVEAESLQLFFFSVEKRWKHISACVGSIFFFLFSSPLQSFLSSFGFSTHFFFKEVCRVWLQVLMVKFLLIIKWWHPRIAAIWILLWKTTCTEVTGYFPESPVIVSHLCFVFPPFHSHLLSFYFPFPVFIFLIISFSLLLPLPPSPIKAEFPQ